MLLLLTPPHTHTLSLTHTHTHTYLRTHTPLYRASLFHGSRKQELAGLEEVKHWVFSITDGHTGSTSLGEAGFYSIAHGNVCTKFEGGFSDYRKADMRTCKGAQVDATPTPVNMPQHTPLYTLHTPLHTLDTELTLPLLNVFCHCIMIFLTASVLPGFRTIAGAES